MERLTHILAALLLSTTFCFAQADDIPTSIARQLKSLSISQATLSDGVLRASYNRSVLNYSAFRMFVDSLCVPLWSGSKQDGWEGARVERIEAFNQVGAQGFALDKPRAACSELGKMNGDQSAVFLKKSAWVCVSGNPCRKRRDREVTSGD